MDFTDGGGSDLRETCRLGEFGKLVDGYLLFCREPMGEGGASRSGRLQVFPNLAGFCRYIGTGTEALLRILGDYPEEAERLFAILEDEALNSSVSPTIISAYLKRRLGYEKETQPKRDLAGQIKIEFEHDIFEDGE